MCIESYLQGQDLCGVVGGSKTTLPKAKVKTVNPNQKPDETPKIVEEENDALRKWRIKVGKAMYVLKTTVDKELVEYIRKAETRRLHILVALFSKKNNVRLQLLESELMTISQGDLTINQCFKKVKSLCNEIAELDHEEKINEQWMRR